MSGRFRGIAAALLSVFFGSTYSIFSKYLLQRTIPETLILISQIFTILTVLLFFGLVPELKDIRKLEKKTLLALGGIALLSSVVSPLLFMKGLSQTLAINAIVTSRLSSIFMGFFGFIWLKEKITRQWLLGTTLMFLGILCITMEGFTVGMSLDIGVMLVAGAAVASAGGSVIYKKYLFHVKPEVVILVRFVLAGAVFLLAVPFLLQIHHDVAVGFQVDTWVYFLGLALLPIVAATYLGYEALDHLPVSLVGAITLLNPLSGMILAYIFLQEGLYMYHLWGALMLFTGLGINFIKNMSYTPPDMFKKILLFRRGR